MWHSIAIQQLTNTHSMTPAEHKRYLIESIAEMNAFIDKVIVNIYERRETISDKALKIMHDIIDRKKANIQQFKELLRIQYNHII